MAREGTSCVGWAQNEEEEEWGQGRQSRVWVQESNLDL